MENTITKELYFQEILKDNKHKIYRICSVYAINPVEPQDLFQEVILQIWKSLDTFKGTASINTWVYKITLNVCLRSKMKLTKQTDKTQRLEAIRFTPIADIVDENQQEKFQFLKECMALLPHKDSSLLVLYLDDLSYREIAEVTGFSENNVAVKMKRIRTKLFNCITQKMESNGTRN